jgi:hypothetical protein
MSIDGHRDDGTPQGCGRVECVAAAQRGDRWLGAHLSLEPDGRAHVHHRRELHTNVRTANDIRFAELAQHYDTNPDDFVTAFRYLVDHPIFHRPVRPGALGQTLSDLTADEVAAPPEFIDDDDGLRDMWTHVDRDRYGAAAVALEHGPHLWADNIAADQYAHTPAGGISSHDIALDVEASTYEDAIVALAAKVRARYGHDRSQI